MARTVAIGRQNFEAIVGNNRFYVDKTDFISQWWENDDEVTLITRPRRFGKTLTMNMLERFFSVKYEGKGGLFEGLKIWENEKYRQLQGAYPVISLSFAGVKGGAYENVKYRIFQILADLYDKHRFLLEKDILTEREKKYFNRISENMSEDDAAVSLNFLCDFMQRYYGKKVIILLDEYDTPMQEAYVYGYWDKLVSFIRGLFNAAFKTNPCLERAIMTGITRASKESIFSDLNNLEIVTATSNKYEASFGFTQEEVSDALKEFGLSDKEDMVKNWYDGFTFGNRTDLYNPWSIINFLDSGKLKAYWVNTSSNHLVNELIRRGNKEVKFTMEDLLEGGTLHTKIDEQIVFRQLDYNENAIWSLLLAAGYLRVEKYRMNEETGEEEYDLKLTNREVKIMFRDMIEGWFQNNSHVPYNDFIRALLSDQLAEMNHYMNDIALETFSFFDSGMKPSKTAKPERFYHGFVLGMIVDLADRYVITSNRESGYGRYDVMLEPKDRKADALPTIIMEFKVRDPRNEETLKATAGAALRQIREKNYAASLTAKGIPKDRIREYGFAFEGKKVLIDGGSIRRVEELLGEAPGGSDELILRKPDFRDAQEVMAMRDEIFAADDGEDAFAGCGELREAASAQEWLDILHKREDEEHLPEGRVPSSSYVAVRGDDGRIVGIIDLRYHINHPVLGLWGGHMGYTVRPSERGKGYAKEMLRQNLLNCRARGMEKVMVTCSETNPASEKVILANGGVYERTVEVDGDKIKRYWIACGKRF